MCLNHNQLNSLPENIGNLSKLIRLDISINKLTVLPKTSGNLVDLQDLCLNGNQLTDLPDSFRNLTNLKYLHLEDNPLKNLSVLQFLPKLEVVYFLNILLSRRYWTKLSEWKAEWLLTEENAEVRRVLIEQLGFEKVCEELDTISLDIWR